ncbi:MAG TPA: CoA-binding protein, partial [Myxococcota bacterium]|nr:CoA-binding protein [Myxococcota bacterium]
MTTALERLRPLFFPRGVVLTGVASHPGKFGAVAFHNLLRFGYRGAVFPIKPDGAEVLGQPTLREVSAVPQGAADLAFLCTPANLNAELLRACAARGVRAAYVASGGYSEASEEGAALERE